MSGTTQKQALKIVPVLGAPMAGITDEPFRRMCRLFGQQTLYTEMIGADSVMRRAPATLRMFPKADEKNIVVQLVGASADAMAYAAQAAQDSGAVGVDINMGCPVKKLITNGSGAALMKDFSLACRLVEAVCAVVTIPVSVKMRLGWDAAHQNAVSFASEMVDAGASRIAVHGRTKADGYAGQADWQAVGAVKAAVKVPVLVNGDIVDQSSLKQALLLSRADGALVGRGMFGRPWLLAQLENQSVPSFLYRDVIEQHFDLMMRRYGRAGLFAFRKHLARYACGFADRASFCQKMFALTSEKEVKTSIHSFFEDKRIGEGG